MTLQAGRTRGSDLTVAFTAEKKIGIEYKDGVIEKVHGSSLNAEILRDMLVSVGATGFLMSLRDEKVVAMARRYGDPVELLEGFVE